MLFIPLPFVVSILLLALLLTVFRSDNNTPYNFPFLVLILIATAQSLLAGLRWGYGVEDVKYIVPVLAATVAPLTYLGVGNLVWKSRPHMTFQIGLIAIPALVTFSLTLYWPNLIDIAVIAWFTGFALAILLMLSGGINALRLAPFGSAQRLYRAVCFAAVSLLLIAVLDGFVALDFAGTEGRNAIVAITMGNLIGLVCLSVAAATASRTQTPDQDNGATVTDSTAEGDVVLATVSSLMGAQKVYRDPNLNLDRLARKTGIPSRQISSAINRATTKNVSQYVNEFRISEACELLVNTQKSVTEIMFDVGFQTKSNFNREFRRVTKQTPVQWRAAHSSVHRF